MRVWLLVILSAMPGVLAAQQRDLYTAPMNERRVALVIGNGAYRTPAWRLQNAVNDANDLAAELAGLGFAVSKVTDAHLRAMERAVDVYAGLTDSATR